MARFRTCQRGYAMAALLVGLSIMAVLLTMAMPVWKTVVKREKETELIWRGEQYVRAVELFKRKYANAFPPNLDILLNERFLRKKYKDPMTADGEFQLLYAGSQAAPGAPGAVGVAPQVGQAGRPAGSTSLDGGGQGPAGARGGITGVVSKSTETSLRLYNGRSKYNEWAFVSQASTRAGAPAGAGSQRPGMPPRTGSPPPVGIQLDRFGRPVAVPPGGQRPPATRPPQ